MADDLSPIRSRKPHRTPRKSASETSLPNGSPRPIEASSGSHSPSLDKVRQRGERSPLLRGSPSPTTRRIRQRASPPSSPSSTSTIEDSIDQDLDLPLIAAKTSDSPLISLPQEVLTRILGCMSPKELGRMGGTCHYICCLSQLAWRDLTQSRYPQYTAKEWRILLRRFSHSAPLLNSALLRTPIPGSSAQPPAHSWPFMYHHSTLVRSRNWLAPRDPTWSANFTVLKPVRGTAQGVSTALHQYHLFPTCMVADENVLVCGSGCYESVGDPTTLMIGARLLQVFDVKTGDVIRSIPAHPSAILDIQMDEECIYTASIDRSIGIWNKTTGEHVSTLYGHLKAIYQVQLYENLLISAGKDRTIRFWDPKIKDQEYTVLLGPHQDGPAPVQVTYGVDNDGVLLKPPTDATNLRAGSRGLKSVILAHSHSVRRFAASNGHLFSASSQAQGTLWDIETPMLIRHFKIVDDAITTTLLNNDLVVASSESIQHFDLRTDCRSPVREHKESGGRHVTLDTCKLLLSDTKGFVRIWDWNLFREVHSLRVAKHRSCYYYDTNTEHLFTGGSDKIVKLFDFSTRPIIPESPTSDRKCLIM